jgi:cytochrome d ubiquinol oxidase subunit II
MEEYFRRRAMVMAVVTGVVAVVGIFVLQADAEYVFDRLTGVALPLVIVSAICGLGSILLLVRRSHRFARFLAIGAVVTVIWAWGVAQWPYLLPETMKITSSAAPDATLTAVLVVFVLAALIILPSLGLLYYLDQRSLLDPGGAEPGGGAPGSDGP